MPLSNLAFVSAENNTGPLGAAGASPADGPILAGTAKAVYGYIAQGGGYLWEGNPPIDQAATRELNTAPSGNMVGSQAIPMWHHAIGIHNPMFWLLLLVLLFVGYVGFLFDFSVKRIGKASLKGGD